MTDLTLILIAVTMVSLVAFVGILFVGLKEAFLSRILMALVGFASGSLIGGAFFHLLPEALEQTGQSMWQHVVIAASSFSSSWRSYSTKEPKRRNP